LLEGSVGVNLAGLQRRPVLVIPPPGR